MYSWVERHRVVPNLSKLVFLAVVRRGDVVIDVGANRGHLTTLFSHLAGASGTVYAFEPVPATFECLAARVAARTRHPNVHLWNAAVGLPRSAEATTIVYVPGEFDGQASLTPHQHGLWTCTTDVESFTVPFRALDAMVSTEGLSTVDFLKIDVEGAELPVLRGAVGTLRQHRPIIYLELCEAWTRDFGYGADEVLDHLQTVGYDTFVLVRRRVEPPVEKDRLDLLAQAAREESVDVVCLDRSRHAMRLERLTRTAIRGSR